MPSSKNTQVYVSRLPKRVTRDDLKDLFKKFGKIRDVSIKRGYAFIEFDDHHEAEEAIGEMDGRSYEGQKLVVQAAGQKRTPTRGRGPQPDDICYNCNKTGH
eukprot:TRINITY_DN3379_c0_g1_i2.p4 TRINITY_DN3379_c0_g1~~TRINITY_DN3379_c0_g1_i2.p4  ORF type:complete len:102 (+),score=26.67 TRINITY_DN3379_c0_g1_i2:113-418(+)